MKNKINLRIHILLMILLVVPAMVIGQPTSKRFHQIKGVEVDFRNYSQQLIPLLENHKLPKPHPGTDRKTIEEIQKQLEPYRNRRTQPSSSGYKTQAADSLVMLRNYYGNLFNGYVPNDNDMAISNHDEICSVTNVTILTRDQVNNITYGTFAIHLITNSLGLQQEEFDPKVHYDPVADRFIFVCLNGFTDSTSNILVGFSQDSSSYGSWQFYALPGNPLNNSLWTDFPMLAVNDNYLFLTANLLYNDSTWQAGFNESIVWQIDLNEGYTGAALNPVLHHDFLYNGEPVRNLCPVKGGSGNYGPDFYLLSNRNFAASNDSVFLVTIPSGSTPVPTIQEVLMPTGYHMPLNADQPFVDKLAVNDARFLGAYFENNRIQAVASTLDTTSGNDGIYHAWIDDPSGTPIGGSDIYTAAGLDIAYPNIAYAGYTAGSYASVISLLQSSATVNPGCGAIYYDGNGQYSDIKTVVMGQSYTNMLTGMERWGDYTGCQRRYNMPGVVWMNGSYTINNHTTRTWIAELAPSIISSDHSIATDTKPEFKIFPVPSDEIISLEFVVTRDEEIKIDLADMQGKLIKVLYRGSMVAGSNSLTLDISSLSGGTYILSVKSNNNQSLGNVVFIKK